MDRYGIDKIIVTGLNEVRRELKNTELALGPTIRLLNKGIAEMVTIDAKERGSALGGIFRREADAIRAGATETRGYIQIGDSRHPDAKGDEFGSIKYRQFREWRGNDEDAGYVVYPTIRDDNEKIRELAERSVNQLLERIAD